MKKNIPLVLLVVMLGLGGCGKACGKKLGTGPEVSSLKLIPNGQNILLGFDWKKMQASPLGDKFQEKFPPEAAPLMKDIQSVTLGMKLPGMGQEPKEMIGVITGKFDEAKVIEVFTQAAQKEGQQLTNEDFNGVKIYSSSKDPTMGMAFLADHAVVGDKENVKKSIGLSKNSGESVEKDSALMALIKGVDTGKMLWAVALIPPGLVPPPSGPEAEAGPAAVFSHIKAIDLALDMAKDLSLDLGIQAATPEDAQQMQTMANSYKTLFGSSLAQKNPDLGKAFNQINIAVEGPRMALSLKLDQATVEQLSKQAAAPATEPPPAMGAPGTEEQAPPPEPPAAPSKDS